MTRAEAIRRIGLLREVRVDRGATPNEAAVAARKADQLAERFKLPEHETRARPASQPPPRTGPASQPFFWREPAFAAWLFDPSTGEHSDNVIVHSYRDPSNWKIEIKP